MIAVDTNVVVRLLLGDDARQLATIRAMMAEHELLVPLTVLLETAWVLRSRYRYSATAIADALEQLGALQGVTLQRGVFADWAIRRYRIGSDLADMVHLAGTGEVDGFATFDQDFAKRAGSKSPVPILGLPVS